MVGVDHGLVLFLLAIVTALVVGLACYGLVERRLVRLFRPRPLPLSGRNVVVRGRAEERG
jgi:peptidoglycan/LPS O-acetylase OafA/YrhL